MSAKDAPRGTRDRFKGWSDHALRGYIVMVRGMVSSSQQEENRRSYQDMLDAALAEVEARGSVVTSPKTFYSETVLRDEAMPRSYQHEVSGDSGPRRDEDDD